MKVTETALLESLRNEAARFLDEDSCNRMGAEWGDERIWAAPLFGAARGDDPIFWSERHTAHAHACGLGTFGLCDGLITPVGKAIRIGSVVLRGRLDPTSRPYSRYDEYCSFKTKKTCGACIKRCPAGALSARGHDKIKCSAYLDDKTAPYVGEYYGFKGYGCGLCQTGVPCASGIPAI